MSNERARDALMVAFGNLTKKCTVPFSGLFSDDSLKIFHQITIVLTFFFSVSQLASGQMM